jgi:hypothetical protein
MIFFIAYAIMTWMDPFTYLSPDMVPEETAYEIIVASQVFEHLNLEEGIQMAIKLAKYVAPGGIFLIGISNPSHPTRYQTSPVHKTPWTYLDLYALLRLGGLEVIFCARCNKYPAPPWYARPFINMICRVFRMGWCDTVYAVGKRIIGDD